MTGSSRGFVRRHAVASYFGLAWGLSWLAWSPLITDALGLTHRGLPTSFHYLGSAGPFLAALMVAALADGTAGVRELLRGLLRWRIGAGWMLVALLGPIALFFLAAVLVRAAGAPWTDFSQLGRSDEFPGMGLLAMWGFNTLTFGIGEETGWRGFALPRLQARHGALGATMLLTLGWALWHMPAFFYRPDYASLGVGGTAGWLFSLAVGAIVLTWLFNSTRGSLVAVVLFHGSIELAYISRASRADIVAVMSVLFVMWAGLIVWLGGPSHLSRRARVMSPHDLVPRKSQAPAA